MTYDENHWYTAYIPQQDAGPDAPKKAAELANHYLPDALLAVTKDEEDIKAIPVLSGRYSDKSLTHVCSFGSCKLPVETVEEALKQLNRK